MYRWNYSIWTLCYLPYLPYLPYFLLQNTSLTWGDDRSYPDFTECFQNSVIIWIPSGWLWLTLPFYLPYVLSQNSDAFPSSWKNISKLVSVFSSSVFVKFEYFNSGKRILWDIPFRHTSSLNFMHSKNQSYS